MSIIMEAQEVENNLEEETISWQVKEYDKHDRSKRWYIIAISLALALLMFAFFSGNFLFAVIIIIISLITILHDGQEPITLDVAITEEGVIVGKKFYDYDELESFSFVYKPSQGVKRLYFEFDNPIRPRLSFPLDNLDPLPIREYLLRYLPEDLERTDEPLSEGLGRIFKL
ncbi:MAG: hypothetical protein Q7T50_02410 [Candidatus Magasanikbacteria bacterium]|nr:hypothetical protein [Candidatus Magasanikbacteria bacterium]